MAGWFSLLRDRLVDYAADEPSGQIGGPGQVVQVDEALIGRRKYERGRVIPGTWDVGLIDDEGRLRLTTTPDRSAQSLEAIVTKFVRPGSEIHTDGWRSYSGLERLGFNHSEEFVAEDGTHTQRIESQWRNLRQKFGRGGIRHRDIGEHLVEHVWRRNCHQHNLDPFLELLRVLRAPE